MERGKSREGARDTAAKRRFELYCSSAEQLFDERSSFGMEEIDDQGPSVLQCPYCLDELCDVTELCAHVECEHPFEYKEHGRRNPGYSEGALLREMKRALHGSSSGGGSSHAHAAAAASKQRQLSTLLDLGLRPEELDDDDDDDLPIMALLKALSSSSSAAAASHAFAPPSEPRSRTTEASWNERALPPPPSFHAAGPSAAPPPRVATEESDLQVQFVQQLILTSMGL